MKILRSTFIEHTKIEILNKFSTKEKYFKKIDLKKFILSPFKKITYHIMLNFRKKKINNVIH